MAGKSLILNMRKEIILLLIKRILSSIVVLFLLITFLFFLLRISPGDPSVKFVSPELSPHLASMVNDSFGLNKPLLEQYGNFVLNLLSGNLGISYTYRIPVSQVIGYYLPFTIFFSLSSFIIQITFAFLLAFSAFKNIRKRIDRSLSLLSLAVYSIPSFVMGVSLIFIFSELLGIFPSSGLSSFNDAGLSLTGRLLDYAYHMFLPLLTLSIPGISEYFKYLRDNLEDVNNKPFIENLRAQGLGENEITWKHIIPNAVSPLISIAGVELGLLLGGALITEVIFALPGMGRLTINAIFSRDYPLITGCTFVAGVMVILANILADIIKASLDKRLMKGILK